VIQKAASSTEVSIRKSQKASQGYGERATNLQGAAASGQSRAKG
jgi:hypothetical protein